MAEEVSFIQQLVLRHRSLLEERRSWEATWKELARYFSPTRCRLEFDQWETNRGDVLRPAALDSTGFYAMRDLAAGLHGGMTSPARPWFGLTLQDQELAKLQSVRRWLDIVAERMRFVLHTSNFYNAVHNVYYELGTFGTAFMFMEPDERSFVRFTTLTAGEYCLDVDERGRVDTVFRNINMTLRQLVLDFGEENLPEQLAEMHKQPQNWQLRCIVVHAVFPRPGGQAKGDDRNKPFASVYYLDSWGGGGSGTVGEKKHSPFILRESGFDRFPGFGVRWNLTGGDIYGRSPAMEALPDARLLVQMTVSMLKAIHKELDPPMIAPPDAENLSLVPGTVNIVNPNQGGNGPQVYPAAAVKHNIADTYSVIQSKQDSLRKGLYNDLFRMISGSDRRQITAKEIAAKEEEKLILIGPVLERLHDEQFIPTIDGLFYIMLEEGLVPEWPEEIAGVPVQVEFVSLLAQAQKLVATGSLEQFVGFVGQLAQAFPDVLDAVDADAAVDGYADYTGVEASVLRGQDQREAMRQQRAQQQQQMQQMQQGMAAVEAMNKLGMTADKMPPGADQAAQPAG